MNQKLEIPHGFALCGEAECLCAEGCLRHRAYLQQAETVKVFTVVNPRFCTKDGQCAQKRMLPEQYNAFMWKLIPYFGRNPYFERRNGKRLISPAEQQQIVDVAQQVGVEVEFKFDAYEQRYNWRN